MKKAEKTTLTGWKMGSGVLFLLGGLLTIVLNSCSKEDSNDVNQDKIWTEYDVYYDKNDDKTHVVARFRFGNPTGTLLELIDSTGANVSFNGTLMPYSIFWSGHHLEFAGNITVGTFKYTNTEGVTFSNNIPSGSDTIAFPAGFDTIVKSYSETFTWTGSSLAANQSVGVYVGTWAWDKDALFYTDSDGANSLVFGVNKKSGLTVGTGTVYMLRQIEINSINGTSKGGMIRYKYRPLDRNVAIVP